MIKTAVESALIIVCFVLVIIIMYTMVRMGVAAVIEAVKPVLDEEDNNGRE